MFQLGHKNGIGECVMVVSILKGLNQPILRFPTPFPTIRANPSNSGSPPGMAAAKHSERGDGLKLYNGELVNYKLEINIYSF